MTRSRGYVFTLNNYTAEEEEALKLTPCEYLLYGREKGEKGTPHLQGFVYFKNARSFNAVQKLFGSRYHLESQRGTISQACDYCKKEGDWQEVGTQPIGAVGKKCTTAERAKKNKRLLETDLATLVENGEINIKEVPLLKKAKTILAQEGRPYQAEGVRGLWIWGPPGTGKTHMAHEQYPGAYIKAQNKWFDGYQGEEAIILDDLDTDVLGHYLKIWADKWACNGEIKGGTVALRHKVFVVTSNYEIEDLFKEKNMAEAVFRRFRIINKKSKQF